MSSNETERSTRFDPSGTTKFPDFDSNLATQGQTTRLDNTANGWHIERRTSGSPWKSDHLGRGQSTRVGRKEDTRWSNGHANGWPKRHTRQKSLSDAIRTIRGREGSVSANAQEIAHALRAPVSIRLVVLCLIWYLSSALTNTSSKSILNAFPRPITLTIVQFAFVSFWCFFFVRLAKISSSFRNAVPTLRYGIRPISREVIKTTLPLALFQLGGHVLSSTATAKIPVSLVHTIKGLSPLFTVMAYRLVFHVHYTANTYLSLVPLTLGVIMACSVEFSGNFVGILCAFVAALIFVTQNIFSKRLFNEAARAEADMLPPSHNHPKKLDKLNLLCYCSTIALFLTFPLWMWTEGYLIVADIYNSGSVTLSNKPHSLDHGRLAMEFFFNGVFHFGQNIIAFVILSMVSPVTYSVASLIKRVFVIVIAIVWFRQPTTALQAIGIGLTFVGLYLYDRTHDSARAARHLHQAQPQSLLPLNTSFDNESTSTISETPISMSSARQTRGTVDELSHGDSYKVDSAVPSRPRRGSWLPVNAREEER